MNIELFLKITTSLLIDIPVKYGHIGVGGSRISLAS